MAVMLQRLDQALERSLSVQSVRWRIEARRTGRSFAEVVMLRTLVYRVEEVFLIHTDTGLVLEHASSGPGVRSPDEVASMLAAIDSFLHEAFRPLADPAHLRLFEAGDLTVWVDRGAPATVAAVVRGVAPRALGGVIREARERISLELAAPLTDFQDDVAPFVAARPELEACLQEQRRAPAPRSRAWLAVAAAAVLAAIGLGVGSHLSAERRLGRYVSALAAEPGIAVTSAHRSGSRYTVAGFADPLAVPPATVVERQGLPPADLRFRPFQSLDDEITARRVVAALRPPPSASVAVEQGTMRLAGTAPRGWIDRARLIGPAVAGVAAIDDRALRTTEAVAAADAAASRLERSRVRFERGSDVIPPDQRQAVGVAADRARTLVAGAAAAKLSPCVTVTGWADRTGSDARNQVVSAGRADRVAAALRARGVPPEALRARGAGVRAGAPSHAEARVVAFPVTLAAPDGARCQERR
jgi:OOP family OmpA-OmpF porin